MKTKLKLNSELIANNQFGIKSKGYDAFEVDSMLDKIVQDYETVENSEVLSKEEYDAMNKKIDELKKEIINLTIELKKEKDRTKYIQDTKRGGLDNYELLVRIGKLEKIINDKLHMSLEEIESIN